MITSLHRNHAAARRRRRAVPLALLGLLSSACMVKSGAQAGAGPARLLGVNFSGAELNGGRPNARLGFDYIYPKPAELHWAAQHHMTVIRLPVRWERLQPQLMQALDDREITHLAGVVDQAASLGLSVIIDPHDYGAYQGQQVGSDAVPDAAFADFWRRMAARFRATPTAIFGLMNEPHAMPAPRWRISAEAALRAIRGAGAHNLVLVPGVAWDQANDWSKGGANSNAAAFASLQDPGHNMAFEFHQYFDQWASGTRPDCQPPAAALARLQDATDWLAQGHRRGVLGEFGLSAAPDCLATLDAVLGFMDRSRDVWLGWAYWSAGGWWNHYMFSVEPVHGAETPQMAVLDRYLGKARGSAPGPAKGRDP